FLIISSDGFSFPESAIRCVSRGKAGMAGDFVLGVDIAKILFALIYGEQINNLLKNFLTSE
ncbi:hypothetical protein, partial [Serratia marcescens]|uniref:hypothetical protein n=1 Tax=Serratia marcescens TaxID=615 RepID=UPI003F81E922